MGKGKGKISNRPYIKSSEYIEDGWGGKASKIDAPDFKLPFENCCLSLQPFENPTATTDGYIYDVENILLWLTKHKVDPCTGKTLSFKDLIPLKIEKNENGVFYCPISLKEFNSHSHIVFIRTSGRVYLYDSIKKLCSKSSTWSDPTSGEPFSKEDIISLQTSQESDLRKPSSFYHVKHDMKYKESNEKETSKYIALGRSEIETLERVNLAMPTEKKKSEKLRYTDGASYTSSGQIIKKSEDRKIEQITEKKGYVQLITNVGTIDLEIHCDLTPKTSENFITHCENGYYNGVIFHRVIKEFMAQAGDPSGTGMKGESIWGKPFEDEIVPSLRHDRVGILSMANSGKDTNRSQFFITFKAVRYLDGKHTVFGKVIDDHSTIKKIEQVPVDASNKPITPVVILRVDVVKNPLKKSELEQEAIEKLEKKKQQEIKDMDKKEKGQWFSNPSGYQEAKTNGIGKYLNKSSSLTNVDKKRALDFSQIKSLDPKPKKKYGDFSKW